MNKIIAEVGDIGRFDNPKQLQKLAGYVIIANDSAKHNGESRISYRGRKRLRYVLYEAAILLIGKNAEFREILVLPVASTHSSVSTSSVLSLRITEYSPAA